MKKIGIGLIGLGTIGTGVARALAERKELISGRAGFSAEPRIACDCDLDRPRPFLPPARRLTADYRAVLDHPEVDIVVELIGGLEPAFSIVREAFARGKSVVTANKALLAEKGDLLFAAAAENGCHLGFEGAVCGAIPVIRTIGSAFIADRIHSLTGILNGTCNYILTGMSESGLDLPEALARAREQGYAESDPTLDLSGMDSAHKISLLAALATGTFYPASRLHTEGITEITADDIRYARELGYTVKLISVLRQAGEGQSRRHLLATYPALVPAGHPLSSVKGVYNAVYLTGELTGESMLFGRGAGMDPTAASVVGDIMSIGGRLLQRARPRNPVFRKSTRAGFPPGSENRFYFRFTALDKPGVFARIAEVLGRHRIGIASCIQKGENPREAVPVIVTTHLAGEAGVARALEEINRLPVITSPTVAMRIVLNGN